ncbi:MAG: cobamide remodeling phosphodiesterase CbiR [Solidesulfovibrio sp. DCME]|uniref:cobamide remodeling phosphodiesterase CbiR n=1 Tax=Solidesulfovibrio sp. DCME TaxID=3447380 RepID=UPI003D0A1DE2
MIQKCNPARSWRLAAPSCVWPETAAVNCRRLARSVDEVGLYLLELESCLAYGPDDLPQKDFGLRYHLHLPLDLPWRHGGDAAFFAMEGLLHKTARLSPWAMVLHPPDSLAALEAFLGALADAGGDPASVLLENTEGISPAEALDMAGAAGCGLCLDLGHMLAMGHDLPAADPEFVGKARMLHVYSPFGAEGPPPGRRHTHRTLSCLSPAGRDRLTWMLANLRPESVVVEVFAPVHFMESLHVLAALAAGRPGPAASPEGR